MSFTLTLIPLSSSHSKDIIIIFLDDGDKVDSIFANSAHRFEFFEEGYFEFQSFIYMRIMASIEPFIHSSLSS